MIRGMAESLKQMKFVIAADIIRKYQRGVAWPKKWSYKASVK
jgi:hypothetical protein